MWYAIGEAIKKESVSVDFLKKLFGGGTESDPGLYYYIRVDRTGEVIQVRIHPGNDLSQTDDFKGYFTRKVVVGEKSFDRVEAEFFFDNKRSLTETRIDGGTLVDADAYHAYQASREEAQS